MPPATCYTIGCNAPRHKKYPYCRECQRAKDKARREAKRQPPRFTLDDVHQAWLRACQRHGLRADNK